MRVIFAGQLGSALASSWIVGLRVLGHDVVVWDPREKVEDDLRRLGLADFPVLPGTATADEVESLLRGEPDCIFGWWGLAGLRDVARLRAWWPDAAGVVCVDTFPNAAVIATEWREVARWRRGMHNVHGLLFASQAMASLFNRRVPAARRAVQLSSLALSPLSSHQGDPRCLAPHLRLAEDSAQPRLIFTGRADLLNTHDRRMRKDALGPFLQRLVGQGVQVFVGVHRSQGEPPPTGLLPYPAFSIAEILDGTFAAYVSQFDAQLVAYNEVNGTIKRRVSTGLSTRYAFGLTCPTPLAVSQTSRFALEETSASGVAFAFQDSSHLAVQLREQSVLGRCRSAWWSHHESWSFEQGGKRFEAFLQDAVAHAGR